eukprot:m.253683 g.253683  ORF g.253683 m.253683 type:complete len:69 (+) comp16162_c0_seq5:478-684(+)
MWGCLKTQASIDYCTISPSFECKFTKYTPIIDTFSSFETALRSSSQQEIKYNFFNFKNNKIQLGIFVS